MDAKQLLDNLSTHLKNTIARAIAMAASLRADTVTPEHLLCAVAEESGSVGSDLLKKLRIPAANIQQSLAAHTPVKHAMTRDSHAKEIFPHLNDASKKALEKAMLVAYERAHTYVGTEHLLYGILHCGDAAVERIMNDAACDHDMLDDQLDGIFQGTTRFPDVEDADEILEHMHHMIQETREVPLSLSEKQTQIKKEKTERKTIGEHAPKKQLSALDIFTINLTEKESQGAIDPVIGREREIERVIHILCRRNKNNPMLVGEPGVGKTAIVEGLAKKIAVGDVPDVLRRKKILSLDLPLLIAGTIYRGEFEARLRQIIDEVSSDQHTILFIDEIHNIIGAGSNAGTMDAANILKPALARGLLRCIGATTIDEYQKHIKTDPALERRLQPVFIAEPSAKETVDILRGVKTYYEQFHNTSIMDTAITAAVELSEKYIHDNFLPDKAIDLVDEACARVRAKTGLHTTEERLFALEKKQEDLQKKKESAIAEEAFEAALEMKKDLATLADRIAKQRDAVKHRWKSRKKKVTARDIAAVLGSRLSLDPALFLQNEWETLSTLPARLRRHIVGQDAIVDEVSERLRHAHLKSGQSRGPFAAFLFAGPSGVGKTKLAKILSQELYHDEKSLIKFDMSEFSESHSVSKLLGSPAGYVGHNERNRFTDELRKRPYSVVLFDEFDKAHHDVQRLLLQILDEGELTDSRGAKISFTHAIIILTTNVGADLFKSYGIGFGEASEDARNNPKRDAAVMSRLKETFSASLLGRMNGIFLFSFLTKDHIATIIRNHIESMNVHLAAAKNIAIHPDEQAVLNLAEETYHADLGARNIEHAVEHTIHGLLSRVLSKAAHKKMYRLKKTEREYTLL